MSNTLIIIILTYIMFTSFVMKGYYKAAKNITVAELLFFILILPFIWIPLIPWMWFENNKDKVILKKTK